MNIKTYEQLIIEGKLNFLYNLSKELLVEVITDIVANTNNQNELIDYLNNWDIKDDSTSIS